MRDLKKLLICVVACTLVFTLHVQSIYAQDSENINIETENLYVDAASISKLEASTFVKTIEIAEGVASIPDNAFAGFVNVTRIKLPYSIQSIGSNAFPSNPNLVFSVYEGSFAESYVANMGWNYVSEGEEEIAVESEEVPFYTITYQLNGGAFNEEVVSTYTQESGVITLPSPTKTGYTFGGWYSDESFVTRVKTIPAGSSANKVFYAKWSPVSYSIQYIGNGSTAGSMSKSTNLIYDQTYTLKANTFTKKGYTFIGWNTMADGSGDSFENMAEISNLTAKNGTVQKLYAKWSKDEYSITYHANGGEFESNPVYSYNVTTPTITLPKPTKLGYVFNGWYKEENFRTMVSKISLGSTGDKTFYAKWSLLKYSVQYMGNGATSGSMSKSINLVYDQTYALKANTFKRKGYTFAGWNTEADGSGEDFDNKADILNLSRKNGEVIKLYAKWSKDEYSITYYADGGEFESDPVYSYNVTTPTITLPKPTKLGYVFNGWYKEENFRTMVSKISLGSAGDKTFYAKWSLLKYSVQYMGNGATSGSMSKSINLVYDHTYTLKANAFIRKGYTFAGWNTEADGSGISFDDKADILNLSTKNGEIVKLYAQWSPIQYKIIFDGNNATKGSVEPIEAIYDQFVTLPESGYTKNAYSFVGWNTKANGTGKNYTSLEEVKNLVVTQDGVITLYAKWARNFGITQLLIDSANYIAHRGFNTEAPENTVAAFRLAGERGFWGCETDVYITKDRQFICNHNKTFSMMLGIDKTAREMTLAEIQSYTLISGSNLEAYIDNPEGNRIASLEEYLNICLEYDMVPIIELKDGSHAKVQNPSYEELQLLYNQVKEIMGDKPVHFIGFDYGNLTKMRSILDANGDSNTRLQFLGHQPKVAAAVTFAELQTKRIGVSISVESITESFIKTCISKSIEIAVWTCDRIDDALKLLNMGIDSFTTNIQLWD